MPTQQRLLIAVDESTASERAVSYVGPLAAGRPELFVRLLHVLPPVPREMVERRDTDDEVAAREWAREQEERRVAWLRDEQRKAAPLLASLRERAVELGVDADRVDTQCFAPMPDETVAEGVLDMAREHHFQTLVVGREALPWYRELAQHHVGYELVRNAPGFTVWVVG